MNRQEPDLPFEVRSDVALVESISFLHLHGMPLRIVGIDSVVAGPLLFPGDATNRFHSDPA